MMKINIGKFVMPVLVPALCLFAFSCTPENDGNSAVEGWEDMFEPKPPIEIPEDESWFQTRGLVMSWSDVSNRDKIDYIKIAKETGINTFSIFNANRNSSEWIAFKKEAQQAGIQFEFQEHMMSFLLPRDLFDEHPEYFRMDKNGRRVKDANGCPSSGGALAEVRKNAKVLGKNYEPTNNRYYFWLDDGGDICHCPSCSKLNASDQALMFENVIIDALKELNPDALLAHLSYFNTLMPPENVKPHEDIFLEFAPFYRSWADPLSDRYAQGMNVAHDGRYMTHADYLHALKKNLEVFPTETAQVLEYWMDDSLFSGWNPDNLKAIPWKKNVFLDDLRTYASFGIRHITCYCAYVGPSYVDKFGDISFLYDYGEGLRDYEHE